MSKEAVKRIPGLGMRSLKTAVSVALCFIFFAILHTLVDFEFFNQANSIPVYACAAAIICMQNTVEDSVTSGLFRLFGNAVGGALGILALFALPYVSLPIQIIIVFLGILACMVICNITKKQRSCAMACVVFTVVISVMGDRDPLVYALYRIFETVIGVIIAIGVNKFLIIPGFMYRLRDRLLKGKSGKLDAVEACAENAERDGAPAGETPAALGTSGEERSTDYTAEVLTDSDNNASSPASKAEKEPVDIEQYGAPASDKTNALGIENAADNAVGADITCSGIGVDENGSASLNVKTCAEPADASK